MEIWFLFLRVIGHVILLWIVLPIKRLFSRNERTPLPKIKDPRLMCSAKTLAEKIRKRQLKSQEVINAYIDRIRSVNHILNAVIEDRFIQALKDAKSVDKFLEETTWTEQEIEQNKPLLGVPLTVKESCSVEGLSFVVGHILRKGSIAIKDGDAVALMREAGAIPILVSATPAFCLSIECDSLVHGQTCNAYNNQFSSAGSSGGEGALLGAGASVIGIGSDLAGSLRLPAMFNGVFAHKPTAKIISLNGHWPICDDERFRFNATIGPMARYAEDLPIMMKILSSSKEVDFTKPVNLADLNVYYMDHLGFQFLVQSIRRDMRNAVTRAVEHLGEICKAKVSDKKFHFLSNILDSCLTCFLNINDKPDLFKHPFDDTKIYSKFTVFWKSLFSTSIIPHFLVWFDIGDKVNLLIPKSHNDYHTDKLNTLSQEMSKELGDNGVFIFPSFPTSAFRHKEVAFVIGGVTYTLPFNLFGFPSTQVPMGLDDNGLPIGIQVIAAPYQDHLCLAVGEELSKVFGGWTPPPT